MSATSKPRPRDWHPLADSDPVPGDPAEIRDEVKHMVGVAENLRAQAKLLREIKNDNELKGKYASKLREGSDVLEKHMREVAGRYERVHGHLTNWANELEDFQTEADKVLANAKREQEELDAEKAKKEADRKDAKKTSGSEAGEDPLQRFRNQLDRIKGDRDDRAGHYAGKIRDQLDDVIEDSWWDNAKGWIHDNIEAIKWVLDFMGWVATIAGFIALFVPGLNLLVLGIGIFIAASRFIMYLAGEASLAEVFIDCIGLVTFGAGLGMLSKLKNANKLVKVASSAQRTNRLKDAVRANKAVRESIQRVIAETSDDGLKEFGRQTVNRMRREILDNAGRVSDEVATPLNRLERLGLGDSDARALVENIRRNADTFPDAASAIDKSETYYRVAVGAASFGAAADATDKALGESPVLPDKPFYAPYEDGKGELWKLPEDTHW